MVWNPSFDVTPHALIDAIITEKGEVVRSANGTFSFQHIMSARWKQQVEKTEPVAALSGKASLADSEEGTQFKLELV